MNKQQKEQEIVKRILLTIIRDNKDIFDKLPDESLDKKEVLESLAKSINKNGGIDYLRKLLKEII